MFWVPLKKFIFNETYALTRLSCITKSQTVVSKFQSECCLVMNCDNLKVILLGKIIAAGTNLARGRPTWQSSVYQGKFHSSLAVDGSYESDFRTYRFIHTEQDSTPWWAVDIGNAATKIRGVLLTNRGDGLFILISGQCLVMMFILFVSFHWIYHDIICCCIGVRIIHCIVDGVKLNSHLHDVGRFRWFRRKKHVWLVDFRWVWLSRNGIQQQWNVIFFFYPFEDYEIGETYRSFLWLINWRYNASTELAMHEQSNCSNLNLRKVY